MKNFVARESLFIGLLLVVGAAIVPTSAAAQGACAGLPSNFDYADPGGQYDYRISTSNSDELSGVSEDEYFEAVISAADTWNEQANGGRFRFLGTTTLSDLPTSGGNCSLGYSVVRVVIDDDDNPCGNAYITPKCVDSNGDYTQFVLTIRAHMTNFTKWPYSVGEAVTSCSSSFSFPGPCSWIGGNNEWHPNGFTFCKTDLQQVVTHEFGHALNMGHPISGEDSIMLTTRWNSTAGYDQKLWMTR